ncbi:MAG: lysine--tRNA ligase [Candidatus Buchananbacteria bacterium]|nr:lysine--tRNA ligase [Candidatus Buchananbacteria bacterium]
MNKNINEQEDRLKRLKLIQDLGLNPYADKFAKTHQATDIKNLKLDTAVKVAGRVMLFRNMGKIAFAHIQDFSGKLQVVFKNDVLNQDDYKNITKMIDLGDFIGVAGKVFKTQKGEVSVLVEKYQFLSKALRPLPEKWHGLKDQEAKYRQRYLDLITSQDTRDRFNFRSDFIWELRKFYKDQGFYEIETPVLCNSASGALAKPFITHHNSLDLDVYLRIAPEIYLKEAIIGGYEKIFEVARVFRNEGMDPGHLQDFTMVEHYCAYWDYQDNMKFTEEMLSSIIKKLKGTTKIEIINREGKSVTVDFKPPWKKVSFKDLITTDCGIDIDKFSDAQSLRQEIKKKKIKIEDMDKLGRGNLIDALYKEVSRAKIINPTFLLHHPIDLSPLARKNNDDPTVADRFQLIVNGWEILNAYSELIDPLDQKERLEKQAQDKERGDEEAMSKDDEYIKAMEYGMPPISGWGMGVERIVALLTQQSNLRDVVLFPLMRPEKSDE